MRKLVHINASVFVVQLEFPMAEDMGVLPITSTQGALSELVDLISFMKCEKTS